jgi:sec-independent protein translocase protein TatC
VAESIDAEGTSRHDEKRLPILEHLEELRWRIVKCAAVVLVGAIVAYLYRTQLIDLLRRPYEIAFPDGSPLVVLSPTEQFATAMKVAIYGGLVLASPVLFYQTWAFINPALTPRERRWAIPLVAAFVLLFAVGTTFAYWVLPRGLGFLLQIIPDVESTLRIGEYMSFVTRFLLVFGLAFEFPLFLFAGAATGLVSSEQLGRGRRWAVLVIVVLGAAVTPTGDPLTLALLAVPLYIFYEATIWLVRLVLRR